METVEKRQGLKVACLEEIAFNNGWLSEADIHRIGTGLSKNDYGRYLLKLVGQR